MLRHADPRLTANIYTHVDLADLRAGVARLPPLVPTVSPRADFPKNEGREQSGNPSNLAALDWSGRQDLNLRPPGPERGQTESHSVSSAGTAPQPPEITSDAEPAGSDGVAESGYVETPFGAPVVRELPPDPGPQEFLLTAKMVAGRLGL